MKRYHEQSPAFLQSEEEVRNRVLDYNARVAEVNSLFQRWTWLWRSIILSSFDGKTYKPYCRYVRVLDFRNLSLMLEDFKLAGPVRTQFFAKELKPFLFQKMEYNRSLVDVQPVINAIGDMLSMKSSMIEEITGNLSQEYLPRWIKRTPKLMTLVLWQGAALENGAGSAIHSTCDRFRSITIHDYDTAGADHEFSEFLKALNRDTLEYFEMISVSHLNKRSFQGLGQHGQSLKELKLGSLSREAMENLNQLKNCTKLHTLFVEDHTRSTQLEALNNDVFVEVVEWLSSCGELYDLTLKSFFDGPAILARVLTSPTVKLTKLSLEGYSVHRPDSAAFHTALPEQIALESVWLKGDGVDTTPDDLTIMVDALCNLSSLRELILKDVSDEFDAAHIAQLAMSLPRLEEFWTSGGEVDSLILSALGQLPNLKSLTLYAMTQFDSASMIDFIGGLNPETQQGFYFALMASDPEFDLTEPEQELIRDMLRARLGGRFDFVLWREEAPSDSEDD